jgi:FMN-dependent NADH-azoreductase
VITASSDRPLSAFLDAYRDTHPDDEIVEWDLWDGTLPDFGPAAADAKMDVFAGADPQGDDARAWQRAIDTFRRFDAADRYLFSVPMWNAGVPYILKQFIDVISQPGLVFGFEPERGSTGLLQEKQRGSTGLLQEKKAAVIYASAVYGPGRGPAFGADFQRPFLDDWLRWTGIDDLTAIEFRPDGQIRNRYAVLPGATSWIFSGLAFIRPHSGS